MKSHLHQFTRYNFWANSKLCEFASRLEPGLIDKEVISSFPTLRKTYYHIWDAETIWYNRLNGFSATSWPSENLEAGFAGFEAYLLNQSQKFVDYVSLKPDGYFQTTCRFRDLTGNEYQQKVSDIIQHCMNHSTFHRGQLVTMLRHLGFTQLSSTDFITFLRNQDEAKSELDKIY
jgi:uncharacterized damage-inducible protein DinB